MLPPLFPNSVAERTELRRRTPGQSGIVRVAALMVSLALTAAACGPPPTIQTRQSNIVLITIDTLRADHLSSYGYPRLTSPVMDRLASEGVRFDQPAVQWPKTGPSMASIFTSTYPKNNNVVRKIGIPLQEEFLMLAEVLQQQGYETHAVVSNGALGTEFNFQQGFDSYVETWRGAEAPEEKATNDASVVTRLALERVEQLSKKRPFFLWVHYLDPHFPYVHPPEYNDLFQDDQWFDSEVRVPINRAAKRQRVQAIGRVQVLDEREDLAFYVARYDAGIRYVDDELGGLLERLKRRGLMKETITVVTSDHGESLGDHNYYFDHGRFSFQSCLRVPLILHFPRYVSPRVDRHPVELLDLAPTLLEVAGNVLPEGHWNEGRSLLPRLILPGDGVEPDPEIAFSEAGYATKRRWQKIARDERYKLIYAPFLQEQRGIGGPGQPFALFDLHNDPNELVNLADEQPEIRDRLYQAMSDWWLTEFDLQAAASGEQGEMSEETRKQLEALGYL